MSYSVMRFEGSEYAPIDEDYSTAQEAATSARRFSTHYSEGVVAVVNDETDEVVWGHVYQFGREIPRQLVNSYVYGVGRFM